MCRMVPLCNEIPYRRRITFDIDCKIYANIATITSSDNSIVNNC